MSEDAERDTDNPGPFEAQTELGSVCTSLALEEVARLRDAEREAYRRRMGVICSICGSDMTVQDREGTAFCLSCENAGLRKRIRELEAALDWLLPSKLFEETKPFADNLVIVLSVPAFDDMYCGQVRLGKFRAAAALKGDADDVSA